MSGTTTPVAGEPAGGPRPAPDRTAEVRAWLRARRGAEARRRFVSRLYTAVVLLGGWYGLFLAGLLAESGRRPFAVHAAVTEAVLPAGLTTAAALVVWATVRDALWRGPVTPPAPVVDLLLTLPVRRRTFLLPWFWLSAGIWSTAGLLLGLVGAGLLAATGLGDLGPLAAACLGGALCVALLAVSVAVVVQRSRRAADAVHRVTPWAVAALLLGGAQTAAARGGGRARWLETAELWSGPWGWAAQPVLAAAGGTAPGWPVAALLLAAATAVALWAALRCVGGIPGETLRARARAADGVLAGILAADARVVRLATARARGDRGRGRLARWAGRLAAPGSPRLLVVWRDAVSLAAAPRRTGTALLLLLLAVAAAGGGAPATVAAALLAYGAAARLLEPARLDGDDPRRAAWSPRPFQRIAVAHAVVPVAVLTAVGTLAAAAVGGGPALWWLLGAVPVLVAAGLVGAYRPATPAARLYGSPALAGAGPMLALLWNAAGPVAGVLTATAAAGGTGGAGAVRLLVCWAVAAALLLWARRRARALVRP